MNIVVTGVNGFVGKHLVRALLQEGHSVIGAGTEPTADKGIAQQLLEYTSCDLSKAWPNFKNTVDAVINLAGLASVGGSFDAPQKYIAVNSAIVTNLCEFYLNKEHKPRIIIISSGAVYSNNQPMPIRESGDLAFTSPYSVSKVLTENLAAYYVNRGLECVVVRPFNHIGPGQRSGFLVPDLTQKIKLRPDTASPIRVGNLHTKRDYTDVRDVATAYCMIATATNKPSQFIYNVCTGKSTSGEDILAKLAETYNVPMPSVSVDPELVRPTDTLDIYGDSSALRNEFNWTPSYDLQETIRDFIAFESAADAK
jgi:GDP-4-dehydro-6-deoxy-D-mannose reductase